MPTKYLSCAHRPPTGPTEYHDEPCPSCPEGKGGAMGLFVDPPANPKESLPKGVRLK